MAQKNFEEIRGIADPILEGISNGWITLDAGEYTENSILEADVAVIGTGAGGGTTAEILAKAGLKVLLIEEGPLKSTNDFKMDERQAYKDLYQENAGRMNKDGSMSILQGPPLLTGRRASAPQSKPYNIGVSSLIQRAYRKKKWRLGSTRWKRV